jgi:primosomal protein N' (replication factor Y)
MTPPERTLWKLLRADRLGVRFRRQHPIPPFVVDFACVEARLVVEVDGVTHLDAAADAVRDATLQRQGWRVLRVWNNEVMGNAEGVVERILEALKGGARPPP